MTDWVMQGSPDRVWLSTAAAYRDPPARETSLYFLSTASGDSKGAGRGRPGEEIPTRPYLRSRVLSLR